MCRNASHPSHIYANLPCDRFAPRHNAEDRLTEAPPGISLHKSKGRCPLWMTAPFQGGVLFYSPFLLGETYCVVLDAVFQPESTPEWRHKEIPVRMSFFLRFFSAEGCAISLQTSPITILAWSCHKIWGAFYLDGCSQQVGVPWIFIFYARCWMYPKWN